MIFYLNSLVYGHSHTFTHTHTHTQTNVHVELSCRRKPLLGGFLIVLLVAIQIVSTCLLMNNINGNMLKYVQMTNDNNRLMTNDQLH